jgi:DNA (cytosine-5)-methyltransferase 1
MTYPERLAAAWDAAQAPRLPDAPTVISTFAGCGGSSLGYAMAGYRELLAVEWDDNAVATFARNFPDVPVYHGDIAKLSVEEVLALTGLQPGELDVFDGSPPCQGFSTVGKRQIDDPRNSLFREYVRLLRGLQPKVFVMENVSGMVKGKMKLIFVEILQELKAAGYQVSARLLNAMYFGVPQSRERMIFIGVRNDLGIPPTHPVAQTRPIALQEINPHARPAREGWGPTDISKVRNADFANKWRSATLPSPTIVRTRPPIVLLQNKQQRELTAEECALIASFPAAFSWQGSEAQRINRIGNSVPPLFMRAIAAHLRMAILDQVRTQVAA